MKKTSKSVERRKKIQKDEVYTITPKGVLATEYGDEQAEKIMEALELTARRLADFNGGGVPAIIFDQPLGSFETVKKGK